MQRRRTILRIGSDSMKPKYNFEPFMWQYFYPVKIGVVSQEPTQPFGTLGWSWNVRTCYLVGGVSLLQLGLRRPDFVACQHIFVGNHEYCRNWERSVPIITFVSKLETCGSLREKGITVCKLIPVT
jgi:hypothetical protein